MAAATKKVNAFTCWLLLALVSGQRMYAINQHAIIDSFFCHPAKRINGVLCVEFTGLIHFDYNNADFKKSGDSIPRSYELSIAFKENNKMVNCAEGYQSNYADEAGIFILRKPVKLTLSDLNNYDFDFVVPAAAFSLSPGNHKLAPRADLVDGNTGTMLINNKTLHPFYFTVAPVQKIQVWVKYILVDSLDSEGHLWDYFIFNPVESNPDIVWYLNYAGKTYFKSKMVRNSFEFKDDQHQQAYTLVISPGDSLNIEVKDVDDLTPDDLIGSLTITAPVANNPVSNVISVKAGQIKRLDYGLFTLPN